MTVFWTILTKLTFSWIINEIYVNILIFVYGWTHNAPRIPKIYNITAIWSADKKLLTVKPIAVLRQVMKWKKRRKGRWKIYDESHISTRSAEALKIYDDLTEWQNEWLNDNLDVDSFLNNESCMCRYFNISIQLNHKCIISFASDEYIPSY